ncbi:MAG TPA: cyclic-phosphate processing receiver domain-containing protein [Isosphaeraceae bacterium]
MAEPSPTEPLSIRRLFLDDDPARADEFLAVYPDAVWVTTAAECIARLADSLDVVHLDHDLGGEQHVDVARDDCGMAVIRWLSLEPRPHLRLARFVVHSHNGVAAYVMMLQLKWMGLAASASPFSEGRWRPAPPAEPSFWRRLLDRIGWGVRPGGRGSLANPGPGPLEDRGFADETPATPTIPRDAPGCQPDSP